MVPQYPAAQWTGAMKSKAIVAYADTGLIGTFMDVEASRAIRQAEVGASRAMIERTEQRFGIRPDWLAADTAYGLAENLASLVQQKAIAPHVPVSDTSKRDDGTFSREDFAYDVARDCYVCPAGCDRTTTVRLRDGDTLAAIAQNLRRLAKLTAQPAVRSI